MRCVVFQTNGLTPLHIASENGHVECVLALLDRGAAINQAKVGYSTWTAECSRGCVCAGMCGHACVACGVRWDGARLSVLASSGGVYVVHVGMGQHPDHRLQQACGRGCTVRTVRCCRRMA